MYCDIEIAILTEMDEGNRATGDNVDDHIGSLNQLSQTESPFARGANPFFRLKLVSEEGTETSTVVFWYKKRNGEGIYILCRSVVRHTD